jgi:MFS family permease
MSVPTTPAGQRLDPARARGVLLILSAMALMVTYVETMVVPALVRFQTFFNFPPFSTVAWILSAYLLVGVAATPIIGKLGDIYGKKRMLLIVIAVYAVAVSVAGFTPEIAQSLGVSRSNAIYLLIGVRGVQGIGMAMFPLAFAMIGEEFPPDKVAGAQGAVSAMFAGGAALGLFGGAYLTERFGWQVTYHTVIPFAFLILVLAALRLKESKNLLDRPIDIPGAVFLGVGLGSFLTGLSQGPSWGWSSTAAVTLAGVPVGALDFFLLSLAMTVAFLLWEPRIPNPIVDFARLRQRNIWISNVIGLIAGASMFLFFVATAILAQLPFVGLGYSVLQFGLLSLPVALAMMVFGPLIGRWISSYGPRPIMIIGSLLIMAGGLVLVEFHSVWWELDAGMVPAQIGVVALFIAMTNIIVLSSRREETGIQTGMNATFRTLGQSLGPVLASTILASFTANVLVNPGAPIPVFKSFPSITGFQYVFLTASVLGLVGAVLCTFLTNYRFRADGSRVDSTRPVPVIATEARGPGAVPSD